MILDSIILDNIRSYEHEEVEFPRGISLFGGDIGSGKSTVLMAIEFALFGLGSQKPEALLAKKADDGAVILEFSVDGQKYEIKRTLKRKSTGVNQDPKNSWIKVSGEKELLSPSELKQRVLQILRFNEPADPKAESKIFRYAVFTPQEAMKEVLSDSRKRLETIRKAFGIEDYSIAESNSRELLSEIKSIAAILQERFSNIPELESEIKESEKTILELQNTARNLEKSKKKYETDEKELSSEIKQLQNQNNEKIKIESKKENLEDKIESAKIQRENIEDEFNDYELELKENNEKFEKLAEIRKPKTTKSISDLTSEIKKFQEINNEKIQCESEKNSILDYLSELKDSLGEKVKSDKDSLEKSLNELLREKESLEEFADEIKEKQDKINKQKIEKKTLKESIQKEIEKFSKLGNVCPTCKQEITEKHHHDLVDEKQKEVDTLDEELKSITDSFFETNSKTKEIQTKLASYEEEIKQIQKILPGIQNYAQKSKKLVQIEAKIQEISEECDMKEYGESPVEYLTELKEKLAEFERATEQMKQIVERKQKIEEKIIQKKTDVKRLESEISEGTSALDKVKTQLETFEDIDKKISELETNRGTLTKKIVEASSSLAASKERIGNEQEKIIQNKADIVKSKKWQEKFNKVSQFKDWLEFFFIPTTSQIEKQVLLSILQNFNETYTRWYSILVEDPTKESRIDENFTPIVNQDGYDQEIGFLSGGEKTSVALAYRLTLNSLMRKEMESMKSNLLILDEPTDGFSKNQLGKIRELLEELKSDQIILVSHEKELETYVDNIFQISKSDGTSKISRLN